MHMLVSNFYKINFKSLITAFSQNVRFKMSIIYILNCPRYCTIIKTVLILKLYRTLSVLHYKIIYILYFAGFIVIKKKSTIIQYTVLSIFYISWYCTGIYSIFYDIAWSIIFKLLYSFVCHTQMIRFWMIEIYILLFILFYFSLMLTRSIAPHHIILI